MFILSFFEEVSDLPLGSWFSSLFAGLLKTLSIDDKTPNPSGKTMDICPCIPYFQLFDGEQARIFASLVFVLSSFSHLFYLGSKFRLQLRYVSWGPEER